MKNTWVLQINKKLSDLDLITSNASLEVIWMREIQDMMTKLSMRLVEQAPTLDREDETLP